MFSSLMILLCRNNGRTNVSQSPPTRQNEQIVTFASVVLTIRKSKTIFSTHKKESKEPHLSDKGHPKKALTITPIIPAHPFELPPSGNIVINFVNELGYPKPVEIISNIRVNYVYQPWRAILSLINQCLTGKTSGSDKPRTPVPQNAVGLVQLNNVIICRAVMVKFNFQKRDPDIFLTQSKPQSQSEEPKEESNSFPHPLWTFPSRIVFGMAIPDPLITEAIQQSSYYPKYLEMVAENTKKTPQETQQESAPQEEGDDPDLEMAKKMSLEAHQEKGEGEGDDADMERAIKLSLDPAFLPQGRAPVGGVTIRDPVSEATPKLHEVVGKGKAVSDKYQDEVDTSTVTSGVSIPVTSGVSIPVSDPEKAHEALAGPDPEPIKEDQTGSDSRKLHVSLAGPNPEHMDDEFLATAYPKVHENLKLITDERVIDNKLENNQEKSKVREESDSTIPDPSHQTVTTTPPVVAPFIDVSSSKPSILVTPPPINTEATTITTSLPEITPFIALQLRVARLEQEMSEVKKTDHSADVLASIRSQVPTAVDKYLGTKLDDALLKVLERHTADLIEKYSVLPGPESIQNQESEMSPKEIIRIKKEQGEEKQNSTYSIRSTDKVDLEEFDLKSAFFKHMNKIKQGTRLIRERHDSDDDEDDDDDEGPSAGSNQGRMKGMTHIMEGHDNAQHSHDLDISWFKRFQGRRETCYSTVNRRLDPIPPNDFTGLVGEWGGAVGGGWEGGKTKYRKERCSAQADLEGPALTLLSLSMTHRLSSISDGVAVSSSLRLLEPKRTIESRAKRSSINLVRTQHPSETMVFHNEDGNPARANIKQALGYLKDGDGDGNSQHLRYQVDNRMLRHDLHFAQDGDPLQDDVRLYLGDDLKKAQDHSQRHAGDLP
ncbi:hypothetical protein Tco_0317259 [Tanacetum coccineum]